MESGSMQAHELHKKFEELNEELTTALRHQQDALAFSGGSGNTNSFSKRDALQLVKRTVDWRDDVTALAKHIDLQLQHSRALRMQGTEALLNSTAKKQHEEDESSKLRCLRSDIRLLQDFRIEYFQWKSRADPENAHAILSTIEHETKQLKEFVEKNVKREKSGGKETQTLLIVELFEARRDLMSKISEDILKEKRKLDLDSGSSELTGTTGVRGESAVISEKDVLASWDAELYVKLTQAMLDMQHEMRDRLSSKGRNPIGEPALDSNNEQHQDPDIAVADVVAQRHDGSGKTAIVLDEVHFSNMQKLKRELADLKSINAKLILTNSQLEDDLVHMQNRYEDEKRNHMSGKKLYLPKLQKLEEVVMTTAKAFEELKLSVELISKMYKSLNQTLAIHQDGEDELRKERDRIALLLSSEIKKIAVLTKENERKDKLVTLAMAARHEMIQQANRNEKLANELQQEKSQLIQRVKNREDEVAVLKLQLESAYTRLDTTDTALLDAKRIISQLTEDMDVCVKAAAVREQELQNTFEKERNALQQRYDKTKRELMEIMSQNLNLDSRLRKTQEKLNRMANSTTSNTGNGS